MNLRPSGYENLEEASIVLDLQGIAAHGVSDASGGPVRNLANPPESKGSDNSRDDWVDLDHLRALAVAAHALVAVEPERARNLLAELMSRLDAAGRGRPR